MRLPGSITMVIVMSIAQGQCGCGQAAKDERADDVKSDAVERIRLRKGEFLRIPEVVEATGSGSVLFRTGAKEGVVVAEATGNVAVYQSGNSWKYSMSCMQKVVIEPNLRIPIIFFTVETVLDEATVKRVIPFHGPGVESFITMSIGKGEQTVDTRGVSLPSKNMPVIVSGEKGVELRKKGKAFLLVEGSAYVLRYRGEESRRQASKHETGLPPNRDVVTPPALDGAPRHSVESAEQEVPLARQFSVGMTKNEVKRIAGAPKDGYQRISPERGFEQCWIYDTFTVWFSGDGKLTRVEQH